MKIAIHHRQGSFSDRWIAYCEESNIAYKIVNCFDNDIISQLKDCDALLWHHHHGDYKDIQLAKPLLFSLEQTGIKVFPNFNTNWHFDNKLAQKYLLEAIGAPLVKSYVFYDKQSANTWIEQTTFPKVFKLKNGAGAQNVKLAHNPEQAKKLVKQAFGKGFPLNDSWTYLKEIKEKTKLSPHKLIDMARGIKRGLVKSENQKMHGRECGYVYFQEFIANNDSDIRVIVIGDKAFAIKRLVRRGDFRASGSGNIVYDRKEIDIEAVKLAFQISSELRGQSVAFDFVKQNGKLLLVEISYCYTANVYDLCSGYWDSNLNWFETKFNPQFWIIKNLLETKK